MGKYIFIGKMVYSQVIKFTKSNDKIALEYPEVKIINNIHKRSLQTPICTF